MPMYSKAELQAWLQYDVEAATYEIGHRVVSGWLMDAAQWTAVPDPLPDQVFAWALELGGIAYENPTSQQDDQTDAVRTSWRDRKGQILAEVRAFATANPTSGPAMPRGRFPGAAPYPDPVYPFGLRT